MISITWSYCGPWYSIDERASDQTNNWSDEICVVLFNSLIIESKVFSELYSS
jgi:hypothetical protein